jgi:hypothetical protein
MTKFEIDRKAMRFSKGNHGTNVFWRDLNPFVGRGIKFWFRQLRSGIRCLRRD